jgi:predicted nucleic acid-binding protein
MPVSRDAFKTAAKMAREPAHGLRAGDALHLAAALEVGAQTIATLDAVMTANAKRLKMKVVVFS